MYGTVARLRLKPGMEAEFAQQLRDFEGLDVPGFVRTTIYRLDADERDLVMAVVFDSKEQYLANAQSPEQNARYQEMRSLLDADPEWLDGEVILDSALGT
jgi:antibiotic biosynthesis monooxygenase (ABM) superfamily enzyme